MLFPVRDGRRRLVNAGALLVSQRKSRPEEEVDGHDDELHEQRHDEEDLPGARDGIEFRKRVCVHLLAASRDESQRRCGAEAGQEGVEYADPEEGEGA